MGLSEIPKPQATKTRLPSIVSSTCRVQVIAALSGTILHQGPVQLLDPMQLVSNRQLGLLRNGVYQVYLPDSTAESTARCTLVELATIFAGMPHGGVPSDDLCH